MRFLLIILALFCASCETRQASPAPAPSASVSAAATPIPVIVPPPPKAGDVLSVDDAEKRLQALKDLMAQHDAEAVAQHQADVAAIAKGKLDVAAAEAHREAVILRSVAALLGLLAIACGALAFWVPLARTKFVTGAVGFGILATATLWLGNHVYLIPWLGAGSLVAFIVIVIHELHRGHSAALVSTATAEGLKATLTRLVPSVAEAEIATTVTKAETVAKKAVCGVTSFLSSIRARL